MRWHVSISNGKYIRNNVPLNFCCVRSNKMNRRILNHTKLRNQSIPVFSFSISFVLPSSFSYFLVYIFHSYISIFHFGFLFECRPTFKLEKVYDDAILSPSALLCEWTNVNAGTFVIFVFVCIWEIPLQYKNLLNVLSQTRFAKRIFLLSLAIFQRGKKQIVLQ